MNKLCTDRYYFSVEGETEKWYLRWLENTINSQVNRIQNVKFNISEPGISPIKYVKTISLFTKIDLYHLCDYEGSTHQDTDRFEQIIEAMKMAERQKTVNYELCYSNLTFELWLILHKIKLNTMFDSKGYYLSHFNRAFATKYNSLKEMKKEKNFKKILDRLTFNDVIFAVENSCQIRESNKQNKRASKIGRHEYFKDNPDLTVHCVVGKIIERCGLA